ncbi:DEAD/DEAH box helicase family protein [Paracoccaceae bacterium]|nr:DEAD/DEAH box helicase family protein [Paracoccaceae bacterium]
MLTELTLEDTYRDIAGDDLLNTFYIPCLQHAVEYTRAVGYFTAGSLMIAGRGLTTFLAKGGKIKLIFNAEIDRDLFDAIDRGYKREIDELLEKVGEDYLLEIEKAEQHEVPNFRLDVLSLLIANQQLEIKVAIKKKGMYHDKVGLFVDSQGNEVVFHGSANETEAALDKEGNVEGTSVWASWVDYGASTHMEKHKQTLLEMWNKDIFDNMVVLDFPNAPKARLIQRAQSLNASNYTIKYEQALEVARRLPRLPEKIAGNTYSLRDHQRMALSAWARKQYKGILKLATGAGKTITAIDAIVQIYNQHILKSEKREKLAVVITVPYVNLAEQWVEVLKLFNINPVKCYGGREKWENRLITNITMFSSDEIDFFCSVVVNNTFRGSIFNKYFSMISPRNLFFLGDECHHHSSERYKEIIPQNARYLLGLSATPYPDPYPEDDEDEESVSEEGIIEENDNSGDDQDDEPILSEIYVNGVVFSYPLQQAIKNGVLTEYEYYPILVVLNEDEAEQYLFYTKKMAPFVSKLEKKIKLTKKEKEIFTKWAGLRARLMASAESKLSALEIYLKKDAVKEMSLFYVGDGLVNRDTEDEEIKQITAVTRMLDLYDWKSRKFTYKENSIEREQILKDFKKHDIDALVAIRCLDEGIDIPACKEAHILASTRNERQFVQRRGRVLRKDEGKDFAKIYDYVLSLPRGVFTDNADAYKSLLEGEFKRVVNFALLANNPEHSRSLISDLPGDLEIDQLYASVLNKESARLNNEREEYESQF